MNKFVIVREMGLLDDEKRWLLCQVCPLGVYDVRKRYVTFEQCEDGIRELQLEEMKQQAFNQVNARGR